MITGNITAPRFSNVAGAYFIDACSAFLNYKGCRIIIKDSAGKKFDCVHGSVGTEETFTDIIGGTNPALRNGDFSLGDNGMWQKQSTWAISGGVAIATLTSGYLYQLNLPTNGMLIKITGDFTVSNGSARFAMNGNIASPNTPINTTGSYTKYQTVINNFANGVYAAGGSDGFTGTVDNLFFQQVTAPSTQGIILAAAPTVDSGFAYIQTAAYTYEIYNTGALLCALGEY